MQDSRPKGCDHGGTGRCGLIAEVWKSPRHSVPWNPILLIPAFPPESYGFNFFDKESCLPAFARNARNELKKARKNYICYTGIRNAQACFRMLAQTPNGDAFPATTTPSSWLARYR